MAGALAFLGDGYREVRRKLERARVRRQLTAQDRARDEALASLGRTAWEAKVDLAAFAELGQKLQQLDARAGELAATRTRLDAERADLTARRKAVVERFDGLARAAEGEKAKADTALASARNALEAKDRTIGAAESRLSRITADLARSASQAPAGTPGGAAPAPGPAATPPGTPSREQLEAEQKRLQEQIAMERAARPPVATDVERLEAEAKKRVDEIARIDRERKDALLPIDSDVKRVDQESGGATRETASVGREQRDRYRDLGRAVYDAQLTDPAIAAPRQAVAAVDQQRAASQAALDASLALTAAMPGGTMAKFYATAVLATLVVIVLAYAVSTLRTSPASLPPQAARTGPVPAGARDPLPDETSKDRAVQAFLASPGERTGRGRAIAILKEDVLTLGSTADRSHLPALLKILASPEPELRAAAAEAIGMIGPTRAEAPALAAATKDPVPEVRQAAEAALAQVRDRR